MCNVLYVYLANNPYSIATIYSIIYSINNYKRQFKPIGNYYNAYINENFVNI